MHPTEGELGIIILSSSITCLADTTERKALCMNIAKQYNVTPVNKGIEKKDANIFLLMFRRCTATQKEMLWIQSLDSRPCSYLNI
jgi:hypothetical protein